jgi:WhiB family redox-sensing transcriptional regulator
MSIANTDWMDRGICRDHPEPEIFAADPSRPTEAFMVSEAKQVCFNCPVRIKCLDWAIDNDERHGTLGGLDCEERRNLKVRAQRRARRARQKAA